MTGSEVQASNHKLNKRLGTLNSEPVNPYGNGKAIMTTEEKIDTQKQGSELTGGKILAGALYIATVLFVLGFLWQSIASFMLQ